MKFLSVSAQELGIAKDVYVVGGAVRNFLIGLPIKDLDCVLDSIAIGKDSDWFAQQLQRRIPVRSSLATNQYGVAILTISEPWLLDGYDMKGETIEIANARSESYGKAEGKGYKPDSVEPATIEQDSIRREFTVNTLMWRLLDLTSGPEHAEVIDLTGLGKQHLEERLLVTPVDADKTFSDDPTRMLRALKFVAKYGFKIPPDMAASIRRNADKLKQMPVNAVQAILVKDILKGPAPRKSVQLLVDLGLADALRDIQQDDPGFATALGHALNDSEALLLLDLLDLGWVMRTPFNWLTPDGRKLMRDQLLSIPPELALGWVAALKKPAINQVALFEKYNIPIKERGLVMQLARKYLLNEPSLADHPNALTGEIEHELERRYPRTV